MATKNNPGKFDCYENAEPDEPMFVLLARDVTAPKVIHDWIDRRRKAGKDLTPEDEQQLTEAFQCARSMEKWRIERENERAEIAKAEALQAEREEQARKDFEALPMIPADAETDGIDDGRETQTVDESEVGDVADVLGTL